MRLGTVTGRNRLGAGAAALLLLFGAALWLFPPRWGRPPKLQPAATPHSPAIDARPTITPAPDAAFETGPVPKWIYIPAVYEPIEPTPAPMPISVATAPQPFVPREGPELPPPIDRNNFAAEDLPLPARTGRYGAPPEMPAEPMPEMNRLPALTEELMPPLPQPTLNGPPWWAASLARPLRPQDPSRPIHLGELVTAALFYSEYVRAISLQPEIMETEILTREADFDPSTFLDSKWQDLNDPVGNTLTTGGATRFNDHNFQNRGGMRKKLAGGGTIEAAQEMGIQDTNSIFFSPGNQGQTRMVLTYNQPLWKNSGECYNQSLIVLADIDTRAAAAEVQRQLQDHVYKVIEAYQDLCLQRAWYLQRLRARDKVFGIQRELEARRELDAVDSQILRARASVASRSAALARAEAGVRNAETRLRTLTNAPEINVNPKLEVLPIDPPAHSPVTPVLSIQLQDALSNRPEIATALQRIRASEVRIGMAQNDLKPTLNLLLEGYVRGLKGNYNVAESWGAQFTEGTPSYTTGLVYEAPWGNRAAQSKLRRRNLELQQLMHEFQNSLQTISGEVEIATREVEATFREVQGNTITVHATDAETDYHLQRWRRLAGDDRNASMLLDDALNSQDRLVTAEAALALSQRDFSLALAALKKTTGLLVEAQPLKLTRQPPVVKQPLPAAPAAQPVITRLPPLHVEIR